MNKFVISIFLAHLSFGIVAQSFEQADQLTITYRDLSLGKKKYKASHRLHASYQGEGKYIFESTNSDKLPAYFKKFKITGSNEETRLVFTRDEVYQFAIPFMESEVTRLLKDTVFFMDKATKERLLRSYKRNTEKYFSGKHAGPFFKYNWIPLYSATIAEPDSALTIDVGGTLFKKARYKTDRLPIGEATHIPAIDTADCVPFNRFHELRKMKGYGINKFKYTPYRIPSRLAVRQQFEIYFDKNSSDAQAESVQSVIDYLRNNNYSILNAIIEGYSSIEGNDQRNTRLQQKRAHVLLDLLQKYNNEPILRDTVIINPGYNIFRQTIKNTPYQWLDSLSNEKIRTTVNSNYILLSALEPYLKPQRKAILKLVVAKRIEGSEVLERFKVDFDRIEKQLDPKFSEGKAPADIDAQVMGMLAYLFNLLDSDFITSDEVAELLDNAWCREIVRVLAVYHHIIQFERKPYRDSLDWDNISRKHNYNNLFIVAQANLVSLISNPGNYKQREKFKQMLVDIQTYSFDYALMKWISVESLCGMEYPDRPDFRGYKLNQLAFLQSLTMLFYVPCESFRMAEQEEFKPFNDRWLDSVKSKEPQESEIAKANTQVGSAVIPLKMEEVKIRNTTVNKYPPSFGTEQYSPLLFYLKKLFVKGETSISQHMISSDNILEFDVYTLAKYHVSQWGPFSNYFADREVQLLEMDKIINLLKGSSKRLCPPQINQLYLDYHLKALHYINLYFEPGNVRQVDIAQRSLRFIFNYYSKNASLVTPRLSMYILLQLNAFHWIPGKYDGTWYAWNLLKSISAKRTLSSNELYLHKKYEMYYALEVVKLHPSSDDPQIPRF